MWPYLDPVRAQAADVATAAVAPASQGAAASGIRASTSSQRSVPARPTRRYGRRSSSAAADTRHDGGLPQRHRGRGHLGSCSRLGLAFVIVIKPHTIGPLVCIRNDAADSIPSATQQHSPISNGASQELPSVSDQQTTPSDARDDLHTLGSLDHVATTAGVPARLDPEP